MGITDGVHKKRNIFRSFFKLVFYLFAASLCYLLVCKWVMPPITITQLNAVFEGYGLKRDYVSQEEISPNVRLAVIASEDQLFPEHEGFDWKAIEKSIEGKNKRRKKGAAASTISQQTAKNVFLWQGHGWTRYARKAPEVVYTQLIEWVWGKERIMNVYLNVIEMGPGVFGIEAAAQKYFRKPARKLSRAEAAMIVASLPNPKKFTVKPMSRRVKWRYPQILRQMNLIEPDPGVQKLIR